MLVMKGKSEQVRRSDSVPVHKMLWRRDSALWVQPGPEDRITPFCSEEQMRPGGRSTMPDGRYCNWLTAAHVC